MNIARKPVAFAIATAISLAPLQQARAVDAVDGIVGLITGAVFYSVAGDLGIKRQDARMMLSVLAGVAGTMVSSQVRGSMSEKGRSHMEVARYRCLNNDADEDITWQDPEADYSGRFRIKGRYYHRQTRVRCREYIHTVHDRNGRIIRDQSGKVLAYRQTVCFQNNRWERFREDRAMLAAEDGAMRPITSTEPARDERGTQVGETQKMEPLPKTGDLGPDHRLKFPNTLWPRLTGQLADVIKHYVQYINAASGKKEAQAAAYDAMYAYLNDTIAKKMTEDNRMITVDQIALLIELIEWGQAKAKVLEIFASAGRIETRAGDKDTVLKQFTTRKLKERAAELIR